MELSSQLTSVQPFFAQYYFEPRRLSIFNWCGQGISYSPNLVLDSVVCSALSSYEPKLTEYKSGLLDKDTK